MKINAEKCLSMNRKHLAHKDKRLSALSCCFMKSTDKKHHFDKLFRNVSIAVMVSKLDHTGHCKEKHSSTP